MRMCSLSMSPSQLTQSRRAVEAVHLPGETHPKTHPTSAQGLQQGTPLLKPAYAPHRRRARIPSNSVRVVCRMSLSMSSVAMICPSIHKDARPCTALQAT